MYLEEDCDLGKFATQWTKQVGKFEMTIVYYSEPAPCRILPFNDAGEWEPFGPIKGEMRA